MSGDDEGENVRMNLSMVMPDRGSFEITERTLGWDPYVLVLLREDDDGVVMFDVETMGMGTDKDKVAEILTLMAETITQGHIDDIKRSSNGGGKGGTSG